MAFQNEEDGPSETEVAMCGHCGERPDEGYAHKKCCDKGLCEPCWFAIQFDAEVAADDAANFDAEVRGE